jgi:hypothetical protein
MDVVSKTLHTSSEPTNDVNSLDKIENESLLPAGKLRIEKDVSTDEIKLTTIVPK